MASISAWQTRPGSRPTRGPHSARPRRTLNLERLEGRVLPSTSQFLADFAGIGDTGFSPPAPAAAAVPTSLVAAVNARVALYGKTGTPGPQAPLETTGPSTGFFAGVAHGLTAFDPQVTYDRYSGRFLVLADEVQSGTLRADGTGG